MLTSQKGAAPLDAVIAIALLMLLSLGVIQIALTVYAHNAVSASAYEGARAAAELGTTASTAQAVAERMVRTTVGGLIEDLRVSVSTMRVPEGDLVRVAVIGRQHSLGPIPVVFPVRATATSVAEAPPA